ncbi:low-density lipoprotein receptor-related protein 1B-like [Palaemon carinicauda]|uniref:low-density lipoprotein receptor-related protein 1B-like n=1 Tax=Palaemon carinicauda TaxID=392227 RepID=UPI0035B5728D
MKPIALLLLLSAGIQVVISCGNGNIACNNRTHCIPHHYICNHINDCTNASDEDPELCDMLQAGEIDELDKFSLPRNITDNHLEKSKELARKFQLVVPNQSHTIDAPRCTHW